MTMTKKILKAFRDGIPVDARQWTEDDWRDLHEAMETVKERIRERHAAEVGQAYVLRKAYEHGRDYSLHIVNVATGEIVARYYEASRASAERHLKEWNEGVRK